MVGILKYSRVDYEQASKMKHREGHKTRQLDMLVQQQIKSLF